MGSCMVLNEACIAKLRSGDNECNVSFKACIECTACMVHWCLLPDSSKA